MALRLATASVSRLVNFGTACPESDLGLSSPHMVTALTNGCYEQSVAPLFDPPHHKRIGRRDQFTSVNFTPGEMSAGRQQAPCVLLSPRPMGVPSLTLVLC